jgi:hypothetical protein
MEDASPIAVRMHLPISVKKHGNTKPSEDSILVGARVIHNKARRKKWAFKTATKPTPNPKNFH